MQIKREDIAWAAGFFEGEGYITCQARKDPRAVSLNAQNQVYPSLLLEVQQVNPQPIWWLRSVFSPLGRVTGPYKNSKSQAVHLRFRATKFEAVQAMLAMMWPWLSMKRKEQAKTVLKRFHELNKRPMLKSGNGHGAIKCM